MKVYIVVETKWEHCWHVEDKEVHEVFLSRGEAYAHTDNFEDAEVEVREVNIESLIRECCDGETRDDIISNFANRLGMPKLLELL